MPKARASASITVDDSLVVKKAFAEGARRARPGINLVFADAELSTACRSVALDETAIEGTPNENSCVAALSRVNAGLLVVMAGGAYAMNHGGSNFKFGAGPGPVGGIAFENSKEYRAAVVARILARPAWRRVAQLEASSRADTREEWVLLYFIVPVPIGGTTAALDEW